MTQKSQARLARDQQAKEVANLKCWDDLNTTANAIMTGMELSNGTMRIVLEDRSLFVSMPDRAGCIAAIQTLTADLNTFTKELAAIGSEHAGKVGGHNGDNQELYESLRIGEMYHAFQSRYQSVVLPNVAIITEQIALAKNKQAQTPIIDTTKLPDAQNVDVVTDVQPKASSGRGMTASIYHVDESPFQVGIETSVASPAAEQAGSAAA